MYIDTPFGDPYMMTKLSLKDSYTLTPQILKWNFINNTLKGRQKKKKQKKNWTNRNKSQHLQTAVMKTIYSTDK